jgi:pyruvate/2-oxoglutarate dehydrogenase complex dihydrolipoamide acyltransferase (E2) component
MSYQFVQVRTVGEHQFPIKHRGKFVSGDVIPVIPQELVSFPDKLTVHYGGVVKATEDAAALMHKYLVRVQDVKGTGKDGRILQDDVINAMDDFQRGQYELDQAKAKEAEKTAEA